MLQPTYSHFLIQWPLLPFLLNLWPGTQLLKSVLVCELITPLNGSWLVHDVLLGEEKVFLTQVNLFVCFKNVNDIKDTHSEVYLLCSPFSCPWSWPSDILFMTSSSDTDSNIFNNLIRLIFPIHEFVTISSCFIVPEVYFPPTFVHFPFLSGFFQ